MSWAAERLLRHKGRQKNADDMLPRAGKGCQGLLKYCKGAVERLKGMVRG
jgi:hypothetical protein